MDSLIDVVNYSMATAALILVIVCILSITMSRSIDRWSRHFLSIMFIVMLLYIISELSSLIYWMQDNPSPLFSPKTSLFFESFFSGLLMPILAFYLFHCTGEEIRKSRLFFTICFLFATYVILLSVTQFTTFIYYYTPDNVYHRGPWYPLLLVPPILIMLTLFIALIRRRRNLSDRQFLSFLLYILLPLLGMLTQLLFYGLYGIMFFTTIAILFMYVSALVDQAERYGRQQEEIARQRSSIMVLQMRPHFIYNTLLSIYYLCQQNPEKAQRVILDFSSYLRQNFTAIAKEDMILFPEELEHTRAYLAVEQTRFEGNLFVNFDTEYTHFRLPPLTLQPIVENAVKHGVDPNLEPLTITIRTCKIGDKSEVIVEDNGPGFSPTDNDEPHIALANIRERLSFMCNGKLTIHSNPNGGTTVIISVPSHS